MQDFFPFIQKKTGEATQKAIFFITDPDVCFHFVIKRDFLFFRKKSLAKENQRKKTIHTSTRVK
jgi:hypothetical protein